MRFPFTPACLKALKLKRRLLLAAVSLAACSVPAQTVAADPPASQYTYDPAAHAYFVTGESYFNSIVNYTDILIGKNNATDFQTVPGQFTVTFRPDLVNFYGDGKYIYPDGKTYKNAHVFGSHILHSTGGLVANLTLHDSSVCNFENGRIEYEVTVVDHATLNLSGGFMRNVSTWDDGTTNITGGQGNLYSFGNSMTNVSGGRIGEFFLFDSSTGNFQGGAADHISPRGDSRMQISGGITGQLVTNDRSITDITAGQVYFAEMFDNSILNTSVGIPGGIVTWGSNTVNISGGDTYGVTLNDHSTLNFSGGKTRISSLGGNTNFTGGELNEYLYAFSDSKVNFYGGTIEGATVFQIGDSAITFHGLGLSFSNPVAGFDTFANVPGVFYDLQWTREDGQVINGRYFDSYGSVNAAAPEGVVLVVVPEPATTSMVLITALAFGCRRNLYRRKAWAGM